MATTDFTIKLLVDKKANKVLFAEAGKEVVDFLFGMMSLPIGSVIKLLNKNRMVGSIGNLYGSIESLNETYIVSKSNKEFLLNPTSGNVPLLMTKDTVSDGKYYMCPRKCNYTIADVSTAECPRCRMTMSSEATITSNSKNRASFSTGGFVKEVVTYMVMDDLVVCPMSTISSITLLNKFSVEDVKFLDEKVVNFGMKEGLDLLKTSLESKRVLSNIFLRGGLLEEEIGL